MVEGNKSVGANSGPFHDLITPHMAETPEGSRPDLVNTSSHSNSNGTALQSPTLLDDKATIPIERTISCVSCRRRKLKCDRAKPKCGTCSRLRHECEYPERRRNLGSKRRNIKELEARLAQVETQLVAETSKNTPPDTTTQNATPDWNSYPMDFNMDFGDNPLLEFPIPDAAFTFQPQIPDGDFFSQEVISLGLQESLPPDEIIEELHHIYFEKFHPTMPFIHKNRYLTSLHLPAHMRPPVCLRYAIWATAASLSENYKQYDDMLYERARRYIEQAEMKGRGETFVTVSHVQCWSLIATYEAKKTYFTRAWMSTGRTVRLCYMLGLHRMDGDPALQDSKQILQAPKDWIELEERRRALWGAFYGDRWASSGTGWPMSMDEKLITTHLPASEEAFDNGNMETSISLHDALTGEGASKVTPFGGVILSACLFGHNFVHLHTYGPNERQHDLQNGEFWKRHRMMDNVLSNFFMCLPDHLRLPGGVRDMNIVFLHMNIHSSAVCLHQAAVLTAGRNNISETFIRQSRARSLMAAEEIANIMKLISHFDVALMNAWMGFCLYVACGVFIQDLRNDQTSFQSKANLEFLVSAMRAFGKTHSITAHFTAQVELDIENSSFRKDGVEQKTGTFSDKVYMSIPGSIPGSNTVISQVWSFDTELGEAEKVDPVVECNPSKQSPAPGIYPIGHGQTVHQPGNHSFTDFTAGAMPPVVERRKQVRHESTDPYGTREYSYLGIKSTGSGPGVHNLTKVSGYHYGLPTTDGVPTIPTTNQKQTLPMRSSIGNKKNYATQMPDSFDKSTPFDRQGIQTEILSRFVEEEDSSGIQSSDSSDPNGSPQPPIMATNGVMNKTLFSSSNPAGSTATQYSCRHLSNLSKVSYSLFPNEAGTTDVATGWTFDPQGIKEVCAIPNNPPNLMSRDDSFRDMSGDWDGDKWQT